MGLPVNCTNTELSTYLQALEEGYLPIFCLGINPSVPSRLMSIASKSYQRGKKTVLFHGFPSLPMSKNSTASHGKDSLTLLRVDSHAKTSAQQAEGQESKEKSPDSGPNLLASFARFDPDTFSLRIPQYSLLGDSEPFSGTWPQWGMWDAGACWELPTLAPRISEDGSGYWPTPTAQDANNNGSQSQQSRNSKPLNAEVGGSLNPDWVEWLMGWEIGFTALEPLEHHEPHPWDNEPDIPRLSKEVKNRAKRLQAIGNGQVPQCAAAAWRLLAAGQT